MLCWHSDLKPSKAPLMSLANRDIAPNDCIRAICKSGSNLTTTVGGCWVAPAEVDLGTSSCDSGCGY